MDNKLIRKEGFQYAIRIAELVRYLQENKKTFPLCDQLLACGLAAGMNCKELGEGETEGTVPRRLALHSLKEADYIIEMAVYAGYLTELQSIPIREEAKSLVRLLKETAATPGSESSLPHP